MTHAANLVQTAMMARFAVFQPVRVAHGVRNGSLESGEIEQIQASRQDFRQDLSAYRLDGVSRREARDLWSSLDAMSRQVYGLKHNEPSVSYTV